MTTLSIIKNEKFNSYELTFSEKPAAATLELLKANKYRWNPYKKIWYGYKDITALLDGKENQKDEAVKTVTTSNKIEPALLKEYEARLHEVWKDESMIKWSLKQASNIVKLESGKLFVIDKKNLQKHFCFGYGYCGRTDEASENNANKAAYNARTNANYFKEENLSEYKSIIKYYKTCLENKINETNQTFNGLYASKHYSGTCEKLVSLATDEALIHHYYNYGKLDRVYEPLTIQDIKNVIAAYESELIKLEKRCDTYIKKYGTEKLHVWTYLVD